MASIDHGSYPAFPSSICEGTIECTGMTYRQWLIGQSLSGLLAGLSGLLAKGENLNAPTIASTAIEVADQVIRQLEAEQNETP